MERKGIVDHDQIVHFHYLGIHRCNRNREEGREICGRGMDGTSGAEEESSVHASDKVTRAI